MEVNVIIAFLSGIVSFFAPCVIPLLPAYIGYVTGVSIKDLKHKGVAQYRKQILFSSLLYVLGFSIVFVLMGTTAATLGVSLRQYNDLIQIIGGIMIMVFALSFLGVFHNSVLNREYHFKLPAWVDNLGYFRAFLVGVVFGTAWTPCVGAVLGAILTLAATSGSVGTGAVLLFIYSLGISIPFLVVSLTILRSPIVLKSLTRYLPTVAKISGIILFLIGFLLFNNNLQLISPLLTYNRLNGWIFQLASKLHLGAGLAPLLGL